MARKSKSQMELEQKMALLKQARELGCASVKIGDTEFILEPKKAEAKATEPAPELKPEQIVNPPNILDQLTDEEILYYATPYFSELQEKKRLAQEAIKQQEVANG